MTNAAKRLSLLLAVSALALLSFVGPAKAAFGIDAFDANVSADAAGSPYTQAGGHPYSTTTHIDLNTRTNPDAVPWPEEWPAEPVKNLFVDLPPGLVGSPVNMPRCTIPLLAPGPEEAINPLCPAGSQVGEAIIHFNAGFSAPPIPLYLMEAPPGVPARLAMNAVGTIVVLDAELRSDGDYGLAINSRTIVEALALTGFTVTIWGVPADPSHDAVRLCPGADVGCATESPRRAFLRLPTSCTAPGVGLTTTARADSWLHPGTFATASFESHLPPGLLSEPPEADPELWGAPQGPTNCGEVPFDPAISVEPTVQAADSPTGLDVELSLPQSDDPDVVATSDLKQAVVTLPRGMSVNPSSANGLGACTTSQIGLIGTGFPAPNPIHFTKDPARCPDSSKIGTVAIETPLLDRTVNGSVYLAAQNDNPFKSLLAMYIVAEDPQSGVVIKLPGHVDAKADGQLVTSFDNQPQLPFERLHLELFDGPRAALRTPPTCGTHTTTAQLTPWARPDSPVALQSSFPLTSGPGGTPCASLGGFDPKLSAGSVNPLGGAKSPFTLHLSRADGEQEFGGVEVANPPGFAAVLKGVPYCPEAALTGFPSPAGSGAAQSVTPSCPLASQVGTVDTGAGAGALPFHVGGKAYLAGPYKGAPLSLAFFVPALAGPFDLGTVMVRAAAHVDPTTAQVTVKSDPLPTILEGIPLDVRSVEVAIDRPGFALNPTSCDAMAVKARVTSTQGAIANPQSRYQLLGCERLPFKPKLTLKLKGETKRGGYPALQATLRMPKDSANIARTSVALPHSEFLAQNHIRTVCTRIQYAADACPPRSVYGHARAFSPLLDQPLEGPVYLRSSSNPLPDLVAALHGQIDVDLAGRIDSKNGGIRTTFTTVPDAPVSKFVLTMAGGRKGLLENSRNLCKSTNRATVLMDAHNGKAHDTRPVLRSSCDKKQARENRRR